MSLVFAFIEGECYEAKGKKLFEREVIFACENRNSWPWKFPEVNAIKLHTVYIRKGCKLYRVL